MGNWVIHIEGTGAHHNNKSEFDADVIGGQCLDALKKAGQTVEIATFTAGSRQPLEHPTAAE